MRTSLDLYAMRRATWGGAAMWWAGLSVMAASLSLLLLIGLITGDGGWASFDEKHFHLPQVMHFLTHGFYFDYPSTSATAPGTHLLFAGLAWVFGISHLEEGDFLIRFVSALVCSCALAIVAINILRVSGRFMCAACGTLAVFSSSYFLKSGIYLVTEGLAYLGYAILVYAVSVRPAMMERIAMIGVGGAVMVLSRQIFLPVIFALPAIAVLRARRLLAPEVARALLVTAVPLCVLVPFVVTWGGLVPPEFRGHSASGLRVGVLIHNIAMLGILSFPFLLISDVKLLGQGQVRVGAVAAVLTVLLWVLFPSVQDVQMGRYFSVVWIVAEWTPAIYGRSLGVLPLMVVGSVVGALHLSLAIRSGRVPGEWILLGFYAAGMMLQHFAWQRYFEVPALITLGLATSYVFAGSNWRLGLYFGVFGTYLAISIVTMF